MPHRETSSVVTNHKLRDRDTYTLQIHIANTARCFGHAVPTAMRRWHGTKTCKPAHRTICRKKNDVFNILRKTNGKSMRKERGKQDGTTKMKNKPASNYCCFFTACPRVVALTALQAAGAFVFAHELTITVRIVRCRQPTRCSL